MRPVHRQLIGALAVAAILAVPAPGAARQEEGFEGLPPGWELTPGASIEEGALRLEPGSAAFLPDPLAEADLRFDLEYRGPGIVFVSYALTDRSRYNLIVHEAGALVLERVADGTVTPLGESAGPVTPEGAPFAVEISVAGETHRIGVDGATVITAADPEPLGPGGIGLQAADGVVGSPAAGPHNGHAQAVLAAGECPAGRQGPGSGRTGCHAGF